MEVGRQARCNSGHGIRQTGRHLRERTRRVRATRGRLRLSPLEVVRRWERSRRSAQARPRHAAIHRRRHRAVSGSGSADLGVPELPRIALRQQSEFGLSRTAAIRHVRHRHLFIRSMEGCHLGVLRFATLPARLPAGRPSRDGGRYLLLPSLRSSRGGRDRHRPPLFERGKAISEIPHLSRHQAASDD